MKVVRLPAKYSCSSRVVCLRMLAAGAGSLFAAIAEGSGINSPSSSGIGKCVCSSYQSPVRALALAAR